MTRNEEIEKEYSELCALLGDALFKKDILEEQITLIKTRLKELNHEAHEISHQNK